MSFFFLFYMMNTCIFLPRNVVKEERQLAIHSSNFVSASISIAELLLDTCLMPLYMSHVYMHQMYLLVISEPSSTHMTVQIYIFFSFSICSISILQHLENEFSWHENLFYHFQKCQVLMEGRTIVPCILQAFVRNSIRVPTARSDCLSHWHWWGFFQYFMNFLLGRNQIK